MLSPLPHPPDADRHLFLEDFVSDSSALCHLRGRINWGTPVLAGPGPLPPLTSWADAQGWASPEPGGAERLTLIFRPRPDYHWVAPPLDQVLAAWDAGAPLDRAPWAFFVPAPGPSSEEARTVAVAVLALAEGGLRARRLGHLPDLAPLWPEFQRIARAPVAGWRRSMRELIPLSDWPRTTSCGGELLKDPAHPLRASWALGCDKPGVPAVLLRRGPLAWGPLLSATLNRGRWGTLPSAGVQVSRPVDEEARAALSDLFAFLTETLQES